MANGFNELLELAKIDRQLVAMKKIRDAYPQDAARQQLRCDAAVSALAEVENAVQALTAGIDRENMEIRACNDEISSLSTKIGIVKNTKEYAIITERIKDMKDDIARHEEAQLAAMEELENLKKTLAEKKKDVADATAAMEKLNREIAQGLEDIKAKQKEILPGRNAQIAKVEACGANFMPLYNAALHRGKGLAFAELRDGVCSECHRKASANLVSQVVARMHPEKCECDGCGRILFIDASREPADAE